MSLLLATSVVVIIAELKLHPAVAPEGTLFPTEEEGTQFASHLIGKTSPVLIPDSRLVVPPLRAISIRSSAD